jgi:PAS domain S-box-containing protein
MARNNRQPRRTNHPSSVKLLQRPENGLEAFMDASVDAFLLFDENLDLVSINPAGGRMFGVSKEIVVGKNIVNLEPGIRETKKYGKYLDVMKTGGLFFVEEPFAHPKFGDMHLSIKAFKVQEGLGMIVNDITERRQAEDALKESEQRFKAIFDNAVDGITLADPESKKFYTCNKMFSQMLGYSLEEINNLGIADIHPDKDLPYVMQQFEKLVRQEISIAKDIPTKRRDASIFYADINSSLITVAGKSYIMGIFRDITERKKAEEALRESELLATATIEGMPDGVMLVGMDGKVAYVNKAFEKMLGYRIEELVGTSAVELPTYSGSKDRKKARQALRRVIEKDVAEPIDMVALSKDGVEIPINFTASVVKDAKGNPKTLVAVIRDVTERRKAEEKLRLSEEYFRALMENSLDAVTIMNEDGTIRYESPSYERLLGFKPEERVGGGLYERIHPDDITRVAELFAEFLQDRGGTLHTEVRAQHKDGSWRFIEAIGHNLLDNPVVKGIVINLRDITERKKAEEALRYSEKYFRSLIENAQDAIVIVASDGTISYGSPSIERMLGYKTEELISADALLGFAHPDDIPNVVDTFTNLTKDGSAAVRMELRIRHKDGSWRVVEAVANNLLENQAIRGIVVNWRDVTERKRSEEALRASEARYRLLAENVKDVISAIDMNLHPTYVSPSITQLLGYTVEETMAMSLEESMTPASFEKVTKALSEGLAAEERGDKSLPASLVLEAEAKHKDGHLVPIEMRVNLLRDIEGKPMGILGVSRDITERKKAEEVLRISEERYRLLVENANEAILVAQDGMLRFFNTRVIEILGYSREELASKPFIEFIHSEDQSMVAGRYMARLGGGEVPSGYSFRVVDKAGDVRWVEISAVVINWEGRPATLNFLTDITERKKAEEDKQRMEEQLLLAGRLAAVGELSAGVAHELNNPIAAIQGFAQLLAARNDLDETTKNDLGIVYREAQRAAKITQNLLSFARKHEPEKQLISFNEVIGKTLELQAYQMKVNNIELVVDFAADLPKTMADFFQMQQVFINLVNNAEQAMVGAHGKGKFVVKTQQVGNMIQISFADNGLGIPEENMKRIFDPFFTTKEVGKGTGLGLSICYGIVEAHGGRIYDRSKLGEGATFVVEIPIVLENQ